MLEISLNQTLIDKSYEDTIFPIFCELYLGFNKLYPCFLFAADPAAYISF